MSDFISSDKVSSG